LGGELMTVETGTLLIIFVCTFFLGIGVSIIGIPVLDRLKFGQTVRDDGPESHLKKHGTPTMGGIIFIIPTIIASLIFMPIYPKIQALIVILIGFSGIGFLDDMLKIKRKDKDGLRAWQKMLLLIIVSLIFLFLFLKDFMNTAGVNIPLLFISIKISPWIFGIIAIFILIGFSNAVNLTDGVDGLAGSVTFVVLLLYLIISLDIKENIYQSIFIVSLMGAICAFLIFNKNPAKVFMGDTGSIALGGCVAALALVQQNFWIIFIAGGIYMLEAMSVVLQVGYFKISKGKRIFKMAPIHHHFEINGWSEKKVVYIFTGVTVMLCAITYVLYRV
jgi:phospho-N-acetylmuramoyl-pentapeptide-transferase